MNDYYSQNLSSDRLKTCYEIASSRVRQYLEAEINFVLGKIKPADRVLELGCGYGRVIKRLLEKSNSIVGIDTSYKSIALANEYVRNADASRFYVMDAKELGFNENQFDIVLCIQNGISAFRVSPKRLLLEAIRVTRAGGIVLFSSYSTKFWDARLEWFRDQAAHGLIGEIDESATGYGTIVCKDGFIATTATTEEFYELASSVDVSAHVYEIDESSLFCEMLVSKK